MKLDENLIRLAQTCPFPLYVVGGKTRDTIAGLDAVRDDVDICAPATPEAFLKAAADCGFKADAVYKNTGTVKISLGGESYEFASFRSDKYVRGRHVPEDTFYTDDIFADARRRDFKCNAVYYDIRADKFCDPLGGLEDIKNRRISTVAPAKKVFGEDGLRLMRLARIAAQTGFTPSKECLDGAYANRELIRDVSAERIWIELDMILHADEKYGAEGGQYRGLKILENTGVLGILLPELWEGKGMEQRKDFHKYDVLEHSLRCVLYAESEVRLAALLHDVGKPYCLKNYGAYHGHDKVGAALAADICGRLKAPKKLTAETVRLVQTHMYDLACEARESKVRKFIVENYDIFPKILLLKQADFSACMDNLSEAPAVKKFKDIYQKMQDEGRPFSLKELKIKGDALIGAGLPPEMAGDTLKKLLLDCAAGVVENTSAALMDRAVKVYFVKK